MCDNLRLSVRRQFVIERRQSLKARVIVAMDERADDFDLCFRRNFEKPRKQGLVSGLARDFGQGVKYFWR
ncbi:MAG: hypothetical protein IPK83_02300 [Planctomycetes bacterium]|nr:hypothetical protein [Planctomycetota bacterium]